MRPMEQRGELLALQMSSASPSAKVRRYELARRPWASEVVEEGVQRATDGACLSTFLEKAFVSG